MLDASVVSGRGSSHLSATSRIQAAKSRRRRTPRPGQADEIGAQYRRAQLLAAVRRVPNGQPGSSCFFARQRPLQAAPVHLDAEARLEGVQTFRRGQLGPAALRWVTK